MPPLLECERWLLLAGPARPTAKTTNTGRAVGGGVSWYPVLARSIASRCGSTVQIQIPDEIEGAVRGVYLDWLSVTAHFETDAAKQALQSGVCQALKDHLHSSDHQVSEHNGNFLDGWRFTRIGGQLRWSTATAADLIGASHEGRCVGSMNLILSGKSAIGAIPLDRACSLVMSLANLGFTNCRRIDFALDIHRLPGTEPDVIHRHLTSGTWRVPRRANFSLHAGFKQGEEQLLTPTLYIGDIKSDNFCRIYDRAKVLDLDHQCTRFERQARGKFAEILLESLQEVHDSAYAGPNAAVMVQDWALSAIRATCDFRCVGHFSGRELPQNWSNRSDPPALMEKVFGEVAALPIGSVVYRGGFAASFRHMQRMSSRVLSLHCIELKVRDGRVAKQLLAICGRRLEDLTEEDLVDLCQQDEHLTLFKAKRAKAQLIQQYLKEIEGLDVRVSHQHVEDAERLERELGVE